MHPDTAVIRAGREVEPDSLAPVLFPSTTYTVDSAEAARRRAMDTSQQRFYSRHSNPTVASFETAMAQLEGAAAARAFSSGMGAVASTVLALCQSGDHLVVQRELYGASYLFFQLIREKFNLDVSFVSCADANAFKDAVRPGKTKLVFAETPHNPLVGVVDLAELGSLEGPIVIVDSTTAPPPVQRPLDWGVDLSLHSATKSIAGHNDAMLGVVSGSRELIDWIAGYSVLHGACASPADALNGLKGIRTLGVRIARQSDTAERLANHLLAHPKVSRVWYPGLEPQRDQAAKQMQLWGGVLAFELKSAEPGSLTAAAQFLDRLEIAQQATSMGGPETLVINPFSTTHAGLLPSELEAQGITAEVIRVSAGLEHPDDLIADFDQALAAVATGVAGA